MATEGVRVSAASRDPSSATCPICEAASLQRRHCKSVCERCGYVESCEDNFVPNEENPAGQGQTVAA